ncbi:DNA excision repair protein ERCC-6-like 2 [Ornithorhynchus anatinus]|uniref:DNA excision repair protein ERCC-6-like 2 n=1 Tax=Ornithorhynchus anatinus TaxID=9258 RepID=UPI0019D44BBA|nr:DNA excision repair protein ERCC-6-like 2 [Ornithorhynchus anatinus]
MTSPQHLLSALSVPSTVLSAGLDRSTRMRGFGREGEEDQSPGPADDDLEKPRFPGRETPASRAPLVLADDGARVPYTINRYLRGYQRDGARFLYGHYSRRRGCVLGDDMGLGKTVQVISFLAAALGKTGTWRDVEDNRPDFLRRRRRGDTEEARTRPVFLIVAPLSVLYNWKDELDTWGYFKVAVLHGSEKDTQLSRVKRGKCEVALTTYDTLRLSLEELNSLQWSAVIVDEAHRLKNPRARVTEATKALRCPVRIGLTGTALQNDMKELWCLMDWAVPGLLGSGASFRKRFSEPVERGQRHTATRRELATGRRAVRALSRKLAGRFLRRTKALVGDQLPRKEDRVVYCALTDFQRAVYQTVLDSEDVALILRAHEPCPCRRGRKRKDCCYQANGHGDTVKTLYFSYLAILRKAANHAALLRPGATAAERQEAHVWRVCDRVVAAFPAFGQRGGRAAFQTLSDPEYSGKMKVLQRLLRHSRKNGDKVLIFSFSTKVLDVLEHYCLSAGLEFRRLDGRTRSEERLEVVKDFNGSRHVGVCLVSTTAGGLGLNFVGANVVVLFDPTWNPASDLQAIDRVYRIGQRRDVRVFRLISLGTVEEIIYLRQVYKQQLHCAAVGSENAKRYFEAVRGSRAHRGELFGVRNLFTLRPHGSCLTRDILQREGRVEAGILTSGTWLTEEAPTRRVELPAEDEEEEEEDEEHEEHEEHGSTGPPPAEARARGPQTRPRRPPGPRRREDGDALRPAPPRETSLDRLLEDMPEVAFVHSNQKVVGSSRAEDRMSRRAVRDVFELRQFSQLPANLAVRRPERPAEGPEPDPPRNGPRRPPSPAPGPVHPVAWTRKEARRAGPVTVLIGETPPAIRRRHLEEMTAHLGLRGVRRLAERVVAATSRERRALLADFYAARCPAAARFLPRPGPEPARAPGPEDSSAAAALAGLLGDASVLDVFFGVRPPPPPAGPGPAASGRASPLWRENEDFLWRCRRVGACECFMFAWVGLCVCVWFRWHAWACVHVCARFCLPA